MNSSADRTLKMKSAYMSLFETGMTPKQIAEECGVSDWTVYHYLDEIAQENGVTRDSLLVGKGRRASKVLIEKDRPKEKHVNLTAFWKCYNSTRKNLVELSNELNSQITTS